ncbi:MAG: hypothetical protein ACTSUV_03870 [Candidatus Ranarchaeia archaeon]
MIVSLPRKWIKHYGLNETDEVDIRFTNEGNLLITPLYEENNRKVKAKIKIEDFKTPNSISYAMLVKYLDGAATIEIISKRPFREEEHSSITDTCNDLLGFEITRKTNNEIEIKDIMSIKEANIPLLVKILTRQTVELFSTINDAINTRKEELLLSIPQRQKNIERYYYRIMRQLRMSLLYPEMLTDMECNNQDVVDIAFYISYINDTSLGLTKSAKTMLKFKESTNTKKIITFLNKVKEEFIKSTRCFLFKNISQAISILEQNENLRIEKRKIEGEIGKLSHKENVIVSEVLLDNYEKIIDYSYRIALTALRHIL